jgi:hypothetical protein
MEVILAKDYEFTFRGALITHAKNALNFKGAVKNFCF